MFANQITLSILWVWLAASQRVENTARIKRAYYDRNTAKVKARSKQWAEDNRVWRNTYMRTWQNLRNSANPQVRLGKNIRTRIWWALRAKACRSVNVQQLLGCSIPELRKHLHTLFQPGMTWENYGTVWEIDHRIPCASFDLNDAAQKQKCFHFSNLQPLTVSDNRSKGARV
jgi:hypothetical protein